MALTPGTSIGSYQITARIGVGGMGEVYRATDTKLGRDVAIKVLPEALAGDAERLARFDREARTLAALSHPNIAAIYGLEDAGGSKALVMELVEGPTLADRIDEGPIPVHEALPIARQIAEALEAAHEQGIVHRDLKPANVKVRPDGAVKVLDFGLAKAMDPAFAQSASAGQALSMSPTITTPAMTQAGLILGTAAYMSPEQARGKTVDRRTDIWAFGCVFYEMLTGTRPFQGEDVSLTMASVMTATPDFARLPTGLPASLGTYLRRCLEKDPRQRVQSVGDMRLAIDGVFDAPAAGPVASSAPRRSTRLPWVVATAAVAIAAVSLLWPARGTDDTTTRAVRRFTIDLGDLTLPRGLGTQLDISRSGETIIFVAADASGERRIYRRSLGALEIAAVPGTEGALRPFLSPDGQWVAFANDAGTRVTRAPVAGGDSFTVCTTCSGGYWGPEGFLVGGTNGPFSLLPERGGEPEVLLESMPERGIAAVNQAQLLAGGRVVLFEIGSFQFGGVGLLSLDTRQVLAVAESGSDPFYAPTGHVLFGRDGTLFAVPVDLDGFEVTGAAVPVLPGVRIENGGAVQATLSDDGTLVYVPTDDQVGTDLVWVTEDGEVDSVLEASRAFRDPRISPDLRSVAVQVITGGSTDIWIHEAGTLRRLTTSGDASTPLWSPDGETVVFAARSESSFSLRAISVDGAEAERTLVTGDNPIRPEGWMPDGRLLIVEAGTGSGLYVIDPEDSSSRESFLASDDYSVDSAAVSPSGAWVAYVSDQTGSREVYVRPLPGPGREQLVSIDGGDYPAWGGGDDVLLYTSASGETVIRASLQFEPLRVTDRRPLFTSNDYWTSFGRTGYDVHPNDGRLLMLRQRGSTGSQLRVVENWFTELLERAGN